MALKLFAATGAAFLLGIVSLGLSGGGLSHGVLAEPLNAIFVVGTRLAKTLVNSWRDTAGRKAGASDSDRLYAKSGGLNRSPDSHVCEGGTTIARALESREEPS